MGKCCSKCGTVYENIAESFTKDKQKKDGYRSSCKPCVHKDWKANYPKVAESHRARASKYQKEHREERKEYLRGYYRANIDDRKAYVKEWQLANPEKRKLQHSKGKAKRRAMLAKVESNLSASDIREVYSLQSGMCAYCGDKVGLNYHVDHIDPIALGGANTIDNIAIACPPCNLAKGPKKLLHFLAWRNGQG